MKTIIMLNAELNGIEIKFAEKPDTKTLQILKEAGFRWHNAKKIWYAKQTDDRLALAQSLGDLDEYIKQIKAEEPSQAAKATPKNKYGVKVGDIFETSWGYEQTNVDFFQVVELVGTSSVRVREVYLPIIEETAVSSMSADRTYKITGEMLPAATSSVFIKDQDKGDLKRLKSYAADGVSSPQFNLSSFASAHYCAGDTVKTYESWYY